ncbi:MAG: hypothetical protein JXA37_09690 [Chloroflexia bacterium]|nr:hypothetical protein [Chloroflexia bacterium]
MPTKITKLLLLLAMLVVLALVFFYGLSKGPVQAEHLHTTFTSPYNISNSPDPPDGDNASQRVRAVLSDDNFLHVTWMEGTVGENANGPAYVRGGALWPSWEWAGAHDNLGYTNPALALDSAGTVHLVWAGGGNPPYEIYYASKPSGGSWSTAANLSQDSNNSLFPRLAIDSQDRLWVVWETEVSAENFEVYACTRPAGGSWSSPTNISNLTGQDLEPDLAIDDDDVPHVAWRNNAGDVWDIYYTRYSGSWETPLNISANTSHSHYPRLATNVRGDVFVVWEDEIDGADQFQVLFRRWDGTQWQGIRRVSSTPAKALVPAIAADSCNLYVVWTDYRNTSTEIYFSHSTDCGTTWLGDENVSSNTTSSEHPDVVAQPGGFAHIFWQNSTTEPNAQLDIYYSKGATTVPPSPTMPPETWQSYLPLTARHWAPLGSWEIEPNDTFAQANGPLQSGWDYYAYPDDNDDYFYISCPAGSIRVRMENYAPGIYGQMFLYNSAQQQIGWDNDPFDGWAINASINAGTYYVRVYTAPGGQGSSQAYSLQVSCP